MRTEIKTTRLIRTTDVPQFINKRLTKQTKETTSGRANYRANLVGKHLSHGNYKLDTTKRILTSVYGKNFERNVDGTKTYMETSVLQLRIHRI